MTNRLSRLLHLWAQFRENKWGNCAIARRFTTTVIRYSLTPTGSNQIDLNFVMQQNDEILFCFLSLQEMSIKWK